MSYRGKAPAVLKELPGNLPRGFEYVVSKHRGTALLREETPASQRVYYRCKRSLSITILKVYKIGHDQPIAHFGHKGDPCRNEGNKAEKFKVPDIFARGNYEVRETGKLLATEKN